MHFPAAKLCRNSLLLAIGLATIIGAVRAQTVRVDATAAHALAFDPDRAMGSSIDILPAKDFETVYSEPIIKESLSAGWGADHLPAEHGTDDQCVALEPEGNMERREKPERVFYRQPRTG